LLNNYVPFVRHTEALCGCRFISFIEVLFVFPYRGEGFGLPTFSIVSGRCSWHSHEFRGILCAIPCVGNELRTQRIANCSRDFTENTGLSHGAENPTALHAHKADADDADADHDGSLFDLNDGR